MSLESFCTNPACNRRHLLPDTSAGRSVRCHSCGGTFIAGRSATIEVAKTNDALEPAWAPTSSQPAPAPASTSPTNTVGRFVIRGKLGAGAFGTVYRAYDPQLDRVVALKVPNPGVMTDAKRAERFLREAKAAANLRHPHIVPVFDAGKDGDQFYIASAFIDGRPLAEAIEEGGTDFTRAARLVRELAEALAYAHEQGIVHRDVKPANIMLDTHDRVHLMDFGLASRQDEAARLTNDGAVMGTPAYMSPEQAQGQTGEVQPATDQYAVGVVLYELLTGRVPFTGPLAVVVHNVIHTQPESPRKHRTYIPKDLETVCLKAMAKKPGTRYENCQELADDLRRWLEGEPVTARRMGLGERAVRWVKKEPKLTGAVVVVALVLLVSVGLVSTAARRAYVARQQAELDAADARASETRADNALAAARIARDREDQAEGKAFGALGTAEQERTRAKGFKKQAEEERKKADILQAQVDEERNKAAAPLVKDLIAKKYTIQVAYQAYQAGAIEEAKSILQAVPAKSRGWEWYHIQKLCVVPAEGSSGLKTFSTSSRNLLHSLGESRVVLDNRLGAVFVLDAKTWAERLVLKADTGPMTAVALSPDGSRIVTATAGTEHKARVWDGETGTELLTLTGHRSVIYSAAFSPDGTRIVTAGGDTTARVWDTKTGAELIVFTRHTDTVSFASFSPNGTQIATAGGDNTVRLWDAKTGAEFLTLRGGAANSFWPYPFVAFSPDGARIFTTGKVPRVWDAKTGAEIFSVKGNPASQIRSATFTPDGSRIVALQGGDMVSYARVWDAMNGADLLNPKEDYPAPILFKFVTINSDFVTTNRATGVARVWNAKTGTERDKIQLKKGHADLPILSPDGRLLVTTSYVDRKACVWDTKTGIELVAIEIKSGTLIGAVLNPDGTRIVVGDGATARVWDAKTGAELLTLKGHSGSLTSAAFSPDGTRIVTVSETAEVGEVHLWNATSGEHVLLIGHVPRRSQVGWSSDGLKLLIRSESSVEIRDSVPAPKP